MSEWKEYTGTDEQIAEMINSLHGFILVSDFDQGEKTFYGSHFFHGVHLKTCLDNYDTKEYLICNPHPLTDMIIRQAQTGQPVWVRKRSPITEDRAGWIIGCTNTPNWNIPNAEYSFTPFED